MHDGASEKRYMELAEKWLNGTISPEEEKEFAEWYNKNQDLPVSIPPEMALSEVAHRRRLLQKIHEQRLPVIKSYKRMLRTVAAASVFFAVLGSLGFYFFGKRKVEDSNSIASHTADTSQGNIRPGSTKAVLILADGREVVLDTVSSGVVAKQGSADVLSEDGQLHYAGEANAPGETIYNTLITHRGEQSPALTLADGTKVWLNAASSIKFPVTFTGSERVVEMTGEAYFEVARDVHKPFRVKVNGVEVQVLGTHFNVNAYDNENSLKTTLLEGAVKIRNGKDSSLLKPSQQAVINRKGNDRIKVVDNADVDFVMTWKKGFNAFKDMDIKGIMRQVERWYDVDVVYEGEIPVRIFTGKISRKADISEVFNILAESGIHFKTENRKIIISPIF